MEPEKKSRLQNGNCAVVFLCSAMSPQTSIFLKIIILATRIFKAPGVLEWHIAKQNRWLLLSIYNALVIYIARCC